jgi:hypothetical protein
MGAKDLPVGVTAYPENFTSYTPVSASVDDPDLISFPALYNNHLYQDFQSPYIIAFNAMNSQQIASFVEEVSPDSVNIVKKVRNELRRVKRRKCGTTSTGKVPYFGIVVTCCG